MSFRTKCGVTSRPVPERCFRLRCRWNRLTGPCRTIPHLTTLLWTIRNGIQAVVTEQGLRSAADNCTGNCPVMPLTAAYVCLDDIRETV
jgi:hypothetical protein